MEIVNNNTTNKEEEVMIQSMWETLGIVPDVPVRENLAKSTSVQAIVARAICLAEIQRNKFNAD